MEFITVGILPNIYSRKMNKLESCIGMAKKIENRRCRDINMAQI
jgi:hypothetical protein